VNAIVTIVLLCGEIEALFMTVYRLHGLQFVIDRHLMQTVHRILLQKHWSNWREGEKLQGLFIQTVTHVSCNKTKLK